MEIIFTEQCDKAQVYLFIHLVHEHFLSSLYVLEPKDKNI